MLLSTPIMEEDDEKSRLEHALDLEDARLTNARLDEMHSIIVATSRGDMLQVTMGMG